MRREDGRLRYEGRGTFTVALDEGFFPRRAIARQLRDQRGVHGVARAVRNNPALRGKTIPKTGQPATSGVGLLVTKTLVIMGDPQITAPPGRPRGAMLRAYDKKTGQQVGELWMPAPQSGSPMTYQVDGKQYIVVAISGGPYSGEYLAFSMPSDASSATK